MTSGVPQYYPKAYWGYLIIGCVSTVLAAIVFGFSHNAIPLYTELFNGFDADLPGLTQLVLNYYALYSVVPLFLLVLTICLAVPGLLSPNTRFTLFVVAIISLFISIAYCCLVVLAMYLPINTLGSS